MANGMSSIVSWLIMASVSESLPPGAMGNASANEQVMVQKGVSASSSSAATLRTFSVYACVIFLISLELSKGTSLVSAVVLFTVLILLSIGSLPRLVITLSLLHILLTQKYLRMLMLALGLAWSLRLALCF